MTLVYEWVKDCMDVLNGIISVPDKKGQIERQGKGKLGVKKAKRSLVFLYL